MGFLVIDEAYDEWEYPKNKWITGWNDGEPGLQRSATYFREWGKRDLGDLIRRDRNHPSIMMWSIGNEMVRCADSLYWDIPLPKWTSALNVCPGSVEL